MVKKITRYKKSYRGLEGVNKLFVYGTLKTYERNWDRYLAPQMGRPAKIARRALVDAGGIAKMITTGNNHHIVHGEIFRVDYADIVELDRHEGVPYVYARDIVETTSGEVVWTYTSTSEADRAYPIIKGGVWTETVCPICGRPAPRTLRNGTHVLYVHDSRYHRWPQDWCVEPLQN